MTQDVAAALLSKKHMKGIRGEFDLEELAEFAPELAPHVQRMAKAKAKGQGNGSTGGGATATSAGGHEPIDLATRKRSRIQALISSIDAEEAAAAAAEASARDIDDAAAQPDAAKRPRSDNIKRSVASEEGLAPLFSASSDMLAMFDEPAAPISASGPAAARKATKHSRLKT